MIDKSQCGTNIINYLFSTSRGQHLWWYICILFSPNLFILKIRYNYIIPCYFLTIDFALLVHTSITLLSFWDIFTDVALLLQSYCFQTEINMKKNTSQILEITPSIDSNHSDSKAPLISHNKPLFETAAVFCISI